MPTKRIAVLGDGHMATEAMKIVAGHPGMSLVAIAFHTNDDPWTSKLRNVAHVLQCEELPSSNFNQPETLQRLRDLAPDLLLSVNNSDILRRDLLAVPADGIINFHNGPLPAYRGVNIPSWAIINGETAHGISWHYVEEGIDAGPIALEAKFPVDEQETAISLIFKCIVKGLQTLPDLLQQYQENVLKPVRQCDTGHYYSQSDSPNDGGVDFSCKCSRIASLVRGLTFRPYPNTFVYPKVAVGDEWFGIGEVAAVVKNASDPIQRSGRIVGISSQGIMVSAADGVVKLSNLMDDNGNDITVDDVCQRFSLRQGMQF